MTSTLPIANRILPRATRTVAACGLLCIALSGCVTPWERAVLTKESETDISAIQGPKERNLRALVRDRKKEQGEVDEGGSLKPIAGTDEYVAAEKLYKDKEYVQAEKAFHKIAKNKKYKKSEIREDALFMEAEAAYAQGHYAKAHDKYAQLMKDYPATRHLNTIPSRLFKIAMIWLDHPQVAELSEIQQVNHEKYGNRLPAAEVSQSKNSKRLVFVPNFTDKSRPLFDPQGNAVAALKAIWTNDPTGPLADDALMLAASYYARTGDFLEADRHFTILREQFSDSPHVEKAFELGAHVKLMAYQGSLYDGKSLEDSEQLKLATLRLYPDLKDGDRIKSELKRLEEEKAERVWATAKFYDQKGRRYRKSVATYCHLVIAEFPNSRVAELARKRLEELGPAYANGQVLLSSQPDPKTPILSFPVLEVKPIGKSGEGGTQPRYGSKFGLFKSSSPENQPRKMARDTAPDSGRLRRSPPSNLPDDIDSAAKPAPAGTTRLTDRPDDPADDDGAAGHTRL